MKLKEFIAKPSLHNKSHPTDLSFEISQIVVLARIKKGLTQEKMAKLIGTKQSSIARLENGKQLPSLKFLEKIAKALETHLLPPQFAFLKPEKEPSQTITTTKKITKIPQPQPKN